MPHCHRCTGHHWRHHADPAQVHVNTLPHQYFLRFSKYFFGDSPNIFNSNPSILTGVRNSLRWSRGVYHLCVCRLTDVWCVWIQSGDGPCPAVTPHNVITHLILLSLSGHYTQPKTSTIYQYNGIFIVYLTRVCAQIHVGSVMQCYDGKSVMFVASVTAWQSVMSQI